MKHSFPPPQPPKGGFKKGLKIKFIKFVLRYLSVLKDVCEDVPSPLLRKMGNQHTHEKPEEKKSVGVLTSVQQLEEWLPGTVKKIEKGALAARRDVQDWEDENVVQKATQLNTIQNIVEERKTMKRSNSLSGKLANLSIGKTLKRTNSPDRKCRLSPTRSVSFRTCEREEHTFDSCSDGDLDRSSEDVSEVIMLQRKGKRGGDQVKPNELR